MLSVKQSFKIVIFGFIFTFFSSFGQSFFIGLFNSNIRTDLNISHGQFGSIYALATLLSSFTLIWIGKKIDDFKLINYSLFVILLLFFSSAFFSFVNNIYLLFFGIFLLRLSGQGLMSHTATTQTEGGHHGTSTCRHGPSGGSKCLPSEASMNQ